MCLFDSFDQLVTDGLHTFDRRVAVLLLDVVELDERHVVVAADLAA